MYEPVWKLRGGEDGLVRKEGYSAFWGTGGKGKLDLEGVLREKGVRDVYFCGVATGTCVLATVIDTVKRVGGGSSGDDEEGRIRVHAIRDCMGWRREDTHFVVLERMRELGVELIDSGEVCIG